MLDVLDMPGQPGTSNLRSWKFVVTAGSWETWKRPRGVTMLHIMAIGGGGGGGGGASGVLGGVNGGGGGGGGGAIARVTIPAMLLPPVLYVQPGGGNLGVTSGTAGSGALSRVAVAPDATAQNIVCVSGNVAPAGGVSGVTVTPGTGGAGGTVATLALMPLAGLGLAQFVAGQAGSAASSTNASTISVAMPLTGILCMGGAAGASGLATPADAAGGGITGVAATYLLEQQPATPIAGANAGQGGTQVWKPFWSFAGVGGGTSSGGVGAAGGGGNQNGYGSGGGGGGGGNASSGSGGNGGGGLVVIWAW